MKNSRLASWKTALPFLLPSLAGFVVFSIIPMIMQIFVSLTSWDGLSELTLFSDFSGYERKNGRTGQGLDRTGGLHRT